MNEQQVVVIMNGRASEDEALRAALAAREGNGLQFDVPTLRQGGDGRRAVAALRAVRIDLIIACGGDGTLNEVVNGLHDAGRLEDIPVALMPYGTGNDFATGSGIEVDTPEIMLAHALDAPERRVDVGRANDRCFINAVSGGAGAEATAETPDWLKDGLGKLAYFITGAIKAGNLVGKEATFKAEGFAWSGKIVGFVVANGSHVGGNVCVAPEARLDNGLLHLLIFPERPFTDLTAIAAHYLMPAREGKPEHVVTATATGFTLEVAESLHMNLDGEPLEAQAMQFGILPRALRFRGAV
jgi:lipid kinase YegS